MEKNKRLEFRGSSFMAFVPFIIFIVITISLSFFNAADTNMMIGAGVIGLLVGMLFVRNLGDYWDVVLEGLGSKVGMTAVMLWLVVGIYGNILKSGQIVEGLVWMSVKLNVNGAALGTGIMTAIVIGLAAGLFPFSALVLMKDGVMTGAIPEGVAGMTSVCIVLVLVVAMGNLLIRSGCMDIIVNWLNEKIIKTPRGAEVAILSLVTIFGILIAAINTIANICVAPFVNAVGKKNGLHPYRRANILATTICTFPAFLPYGGCVLLLMGGLASMMDTYPFLPQLAPADMLFTAFYCRAIWIVMLIVCLTGWGRAFEGKNRDYVTEKNHAASKNIKNEEETISNAGF